VVCGCACLTIPKVRRAITALEYNGSSGVLEGINGTARGISVKSITIMDNKKWI